ncbi:FGGY-family carbohydrate kinase [Agrococcus sp. HG114]|uniref:FGGY-family carbohydrate kinase n=1 Tax=Agrococcus sp. HG114 TaxID=2969757 RepID=UPI00215AFDEF|nr:FGGY-family carbohydrate kinase [Agrococcus sp. HG114]MCR8670070.1 FGGY-family carbohydrate kinase [Agrococcus sp. HG114]
MRQAVIGVDIGTSSTKGVLVGLDGEVLASAAREHAVDRPAPGHVEMDAERWWLELIELVRELLERGSAEVVAVGVSGMGPCVVLLDADGAPVRPAILYGVDTRAGEQIARLRAELGEGPIVELGGTPLTSQAAGPKIAWVREHEPEAYARARSFAMPASFLAHRLTGELLLDHHSASQSWPLYDLDGARWHEPWWDAIAPGIERPQLALPSDAAGTVTAEAARLTGLPAGIPVALGTIDAWTEAVSAGATGSGDLMLMYGTTMFLITTTDERPAAPGMWTTRGVEAGSYSLAGGMATSGAITTWLRDLLPGSDYATLIRLAEESGPGAGGLLMLPYFAGERTPIQDPDARGVLVGMTLDTTAGDLYRAALEATAFGVRHNIEVMRDAGTRIDRVVAVGGGTTGGLWTRIVSDVTGLPQAVPSVTVGASFGAAFLAAGLVGDPDIAAWNPPAVVVEPDPARRALYDERYRHYRDLYPATREIAHALAAGSR